MADYGVPFNRRQYYFEIHHKSLVYLNKFKHCDSYSNLPSDGLRTLTVSVLFEKIVEYNTMKYRDIISVNNFKPCDSYSNLDSEYNSFSKLLKINGTS